MTDKNSELLNEFLIESFENLLGINEEITRYEKDPSDRDLLNSIYRKVHTVKGSASFLGYKKLQEVTHAAENVLDSIREDEIDMTPEITDILLVSMDVNLEILKQLENTGNEGDGDYSDIIEKLSNILVKGVTTPAEEAQEQAEDYSENIQHKEIKSDIGLSPVADENINFLEDAFSEEEKEVKVGKLSQSAESVDDSSDHGKVKNFDEKPAPSFLSVSNKEPAKEGSMKPEEKIDKNIEKPEGKEEAPVNTDSRSNVVDSTIRVNVKLLDKIMNVVGELVLNRNQILQFSNSHDHHDLNRLAAQLNVITTELQTDIMTTRMQPIGSILNKFERVIRDLSRKQGKKISFSVSGAETELDKTLLEAIKDPLTHIIRNSVDHGIESPETRIKNEKPEEGSISIRAYHEGGQVTVEIVDNGGGIPQEKIRQKAIEKGVITQDQAQSLNEKQVLNLIFHPGFSTAEKVTNISGRGVGMDVVKTNVEKIGGSVDVDSIEGEGTTFKLKIPLTLAIVPALIVKSSGESFAIPQINLVELVRLEDEDVDDKIEKMHDSEFFRLRNELIPIFRLKDSLGLKKIEASVRMGDDDSVEEGTEKNNEGVTTNIVILNAEGKTYGLIVEEILDTQEIVVKPLSRALKNLQVFAGATIMGDGSVALIIDALGFVKKLTKGKSKESVIDNFSNSLASRVEDKSFDLQERTEMLLFNLGDDRLYSIPLVLVNRLEEFDNSEVEISGEQPLVRYRNKPMPLLNMENLLKLDAKSGLDLIGENGLDEATSLPALVVNYRDISYGLVVKEIRDIAYSEEIIDTSNVDRDEILGTVFINGKTISVVDIHYILTRLRNSQKDHHDVGADSSRGRILLVEDSAIYQKIERQALEEEGFFVEVAADGVLGLGAIDKNDQYDLIVTDIEMPRMDGYQFTEELREKAKYKTTPVIALTTKISEEDRARGKEAGFDEHLEKFDKEEVIRVVNKFLAKN